MHARVSLLVFAAATLLGACDQQEIAEDAVFSTPSGLAIAGTEERRLFIANAGEDTLHVMKFGRNLDEMEFVDSDAQFFNLRIPAGPSPDDIVATPPAEVGAGGRFVVVLNSASDALRLIHADRLEQVLAANGEAYRYVIGPAGSRPRSLIASEVVCAAPCMGTLYVALSDIGSIAEFEVVDDGVQPRIEPRRVFRVGGQPHELTVTRSGRMLFATDAVAPEVIRLDLGSGFVDRRPLGGIGGAIAVSQDESIVVVSRPQWLDVAVFEEADTGGFAPVDVDAAFAPAPRCLADGCTGAAGCDTDVIHPADRALCVSDTGLQPRGEVYGALFLNAVAGQIATLGTSAELPAFVPLVPEVFFSDHPNDYEVLEGGLLRGPTCGDEERRDWTEWATLALLDGRIVFVGLRGRDGLLRPTLLDENWCREPSLRSLTAVTADELLSPCPTTPQRGRFSCAGGRVVTMPGLTGACDFRFRGREVTGFLDPSSCGERLINLVWEHAIVTRGAGGGSIDAEGWLVDTAVDFVGKGAQPGDIVEVLSAPSASEECAAALNIAVGEEVPLCELERRIEDIDAQGRLRLDRELPAVCFGSSIGVAYNLRIGDGFFVQVLQVDDASSILSESVEDRLEPGQRYGPGGAVAKEQRLLFELNPSFDYRIGMPACERYPAPPADGPDPIALRPSTVVRFEVADGYAPVTGGVVLGDGPLRAADRLPTAMVVATEVGNGPAVFVSYSALQSVFGVQPFHADFDVMQFPPQSTLIR